MIYNIDLKKEKFDLIDFTESRIIDFFCSRQLPDQLEFKIWGATILRAPFWSHNDKFVNLPLKDEDLYVAGLGSLKISNLVGGQITIYIYDNQDGSATAKHSDGSELRIKRTWGKTNENNIFQEYLWECPIDWPYGFCILTLLSNDGTVSFEFDNEDLISADEYVKNPSLYSAKTLEDSL